MRGCLITFGLMVAGVALLIAAYGYGLLGVERYRYKMTVEVETPQGLRSGYAVREIAIRTPPPIPMLGEDRGGVGVTGEAVAVDFASGKTLFALLADADGSYEFGGRDVHFLFRELTSGKQGDAIELWPDKPVTRRPALANPVPALVTFKDMRNPRSVELVDPHDLTKGFGLGYRLKSITIEVTDEPITKAIGKRLSEEFFGDWANFGSSIAHCRQLDHPYFRQLATRIGRASFRQPAPPASFNAGDPREDMKQRSLMGAVPCEQLIPGYSGGPLRRMFDSPVFQHKPVVREGQKQRPELARWTPGPTPLTSNWTGDLRLLDGCIAVGSRQMLLLFPYGEGEWNNARQTLSYDGKSYAVGDRISLKGDTIRLFVDGGKAEYQSDSADLGKHDFRSCNGYEIFRVDSYANQMRLHSGALAR